MPGPARRFLADWIEDGFDGYMPLGWYHSDPGAKFNSSQVRAALDASIGRELLFPVFPSTRGGGSNFEYEVVGWAGFLLTGWDVHGSTDSRLHGQFTQIIWEEIATDSADAPDFGARGVARRVAPAVGV